MRISLLVILAIVCIATESDASTLRRRLDDFEGSATATPTGGDDNETVEPTGGGDVTESPTLEENATVDPQDGVATTNPTDQDDGPGVTPGDIVSEAPVVAPADSLEPSAPEPFGGSVVTDQPGSEFATGSPTDSTGPGGDERTVAPSESAESSFPVEPAPTFAPVPQPTYAPYVSPTPRPESGYIANDDDPLEPLPDEPDDDTWKWTDSTAEELEHDRTTLIALSVTFGVGLCLAILTAQQMLENPDGCCASFCRILVACTCAITRCVCFPCRMICGCTNNDRRTHEMVSSNGNYTHDLELS